MDRDHKVRICVSHLKGAEREAEILRLLKSPTALTRALQIKFFKLKV